MSSALFAAQNFAELISKSRVAQRIDERVQSGADVPDPSHCEDLLLANDLRTNGDHNEDDEVRHKAHGEDTHDYSQLERKTKVFLKKCLV